MEEVTTPVGLADKGRDPDTIVDGSNVARYGLRTHEKGLVAQLVAMQAQLLAEGCHPRFVSDASLRHRIDDVQAYQAMLEARDFFTQALALQVAQTDARLACHLSREKLWQHPQDLAPVPILGFPGFTAEKAQAAYYDDQRYFRPGRGIKL